MKISAVILAAGRSSRMPSDNKLLFDYGGRTVVEQVLANTVASEVSEVIVVTGFDGDRVRDRLTPLVSDRVRIIHNVGYRLGRAESIRCALRALDEQVEAALFMVGDKPGVGTALMNSSLDLFRRECPLILHVRTPSGRGHPIIFARSLFGEFLKLDGDRVGEELIARYRERVYELDDDQDQIDIDTEADYRAALAQLASTGKDHATRKGSAAL